MASQEVWGHWTSSTASTLNITGGTYNSSTGSTLVWNDWVTSNTTTTTSYYGDVVWKGWNRNYIVTSPAVAQQLTQEQEDQRRQALEEEQVRALEARDRRRQEAVEANLRAEELLKVILTDEQWAAYTEKKEFAVIGKSGRRYLIRRGTHGNVKVVEDEVVVESLCIQPPLGEYDEERHYREVPLGDVMVAQVLGIRHDEESFRKVANITVIRRPGVQRAREAIGDPVHV